MSEEKDNVIDEEFEQFKDDILKHEEKASVERDVDIYNGNLDEFIPKKDENDVEIDEEIDGGEKGRERKMGQNLIKEGAGDDSMEEDGENNGGSKEEEEDKIKEINDGGVEGKITKEDGGNEGNRDKNDDDCRANDGSINSNNVGDDHSLNNKIKNTEMNERDGKYRVNPQEVVTYILEGDETANIKITDNNNNYTEIKDNNNNIADYNDNNNLIKGSVINDNKEHQSNIENEEAAVNVDYQVITSKNTMLENQLRFICDKIEEAIFQYRNSKQQDDVGKQQKEQEREFLQNECSHLIQKINYYKEQTENIRYQLENVYNISKVNQLESEIKKKKEVLKNMKKENEALIKVTNEQSKGINEFLNKFNNTKEMSEMTQKIKNIKEELHLTKECYKTLDAKIKGQNSKIEVYEKKCKIIKDNIEFKKKKQKKEVQKSFNDDGEEPINEENIDVHTNATQEDLQELEENNAQMKQDIDEEERNYKSEIVNQKSLIKKINKEIFVLKEKIKDLEQEKRTEELEKKRMQKMKHEVKRRKSQNVKNVCKNEKESSGNKVINKSTSKTGGKNCQNNRAVMARTPNFKYKNGKYSKPFEINKFSNVKKPSELSAIKQSNGIYPGTSYIVNKTDNFSSNFSYEQPKLEKSKKSEVKDMKDMSTLAEIRELQNEINNALQFNAVSLNKNTTEEDIPPVSKVTYQSNNNLEQAVTNNINIINGGIKRKPFDAINFK